MGLVKGLRTKQAYWRWWSDTRGRATLHQEKTIGRERFICTAGNTSGAEGENHCDTFAGLRTNLSLAELSEGHLLHVDVHRGHGRLEHVLAAGRKRRCGHQYRKGLHKASENPKRKDWQKKGVQNWPAVSLFLHDLEITRSPQKVQRSFSSMSRSINHESEHRIPPTAHRPMGLP